MNSEEDIELLEAKLSEGLGKYWPDNYLFAILRRVQAQARLGAAVKGLYSAYCSGSQTLTEYEAMVDQIVTLVERSANQGESK